MDYSNKEANEIRLNDKYQYVYFYDAETDEIRRIVHCKWSTASRLCRYTVVAQFISKRSGDTEAHDEDEFVSYFINEELYFKINLNTNDDPKK